MAVGCCQDRLKLTQGLASQTCAHCSSGAKTASTSGLAEEACYYDDGARLHDVIQREVEILQLFELMKIFCVRGKRHMSTELGISVTNLSIVHSWWLR